MVTGAHISCLKSMWSLMAWINILLRLGSKAQVSIFLSRENKPMFPVINLNVKLLLRVFINYLS